jgi:hypothetical protein
LPETYVNLHELTPYPEEFVRIDSSWLLCP